MEKAIKFLIICGLLFCAATASGKEIPSKKINSIIELDFKPAFCLPTNNFFKGFTPSAHLKYGFRLSPDTAYGSLYPNSIQGIGLGYNSFGDKEHIGNPIAIYVFQTFRIAALTQRLSLDYEWNFGISFGWKPFDKTDNPLNRVVGSKANAYINLGILLNYNIGRNFNIKAGAGITHFSNGNTNYPNAGVNTIGASLGASWDINSRSGKEKIESESNKDIMNIEKRFWTYDIILYGAAKKKGISWDYGSPAIVPNRFGVAGINITPLFNFNKYFRAGFSIDAQYDESANIADHIANTYIPADDVRFHRPPFNEQFAVGLSARTEFAMPYFSINIGLGRNIICKGADTDCFYQIFALKTHITRSFFIHIGYQLYNFKHPNNLMLGIGYRFKTKRGK